MEEETWGRRVRAAGIDPVELDEETWELFEALSEENTAAVEMFLAGYKQGSGDALVGAHPLFRVR